MENEAGEIRFMTEQELTTKLGFKPMFLIYSGLKNAIPRQWKRVIRTNPEDKNQEEQDDYKLIDRLVDSKKQSKIIYKILVSKKTSKPVEIIEKWKTDLNLTTPVDEILLSHDKQRKLIQSNKLKSFNYKFLLRNIPYEKRLHKMQIKPTPYCERCKIDEDILHLYWECPRTRRLWERLKELIEDIEHTPFPLTSSNCLIGIGNWMSTKHKEKCQTLCILTKHYIHLQKCGDNANTVHQQGLDRYLKSILGTEHTIALGNGKHNLFTATWGQWMNWIYS